MLLVSLNIFYLQIIQIGSDTSKSYLCSLLRLQFLTITYEACKILTTIFVSNTWYTHINNKYFRGKNELECLCMNVHLLMNN